MNKYVKGCLTAVAIILLIIALLAVWFWWSLKKNSDKAETDGIKFSKECDTATLITEKANLTFIKFGRQEISTLHFYIIRSGKVLQDTVIKNEVNEDDYWYTAIPFDHFQKTDTIVVETRSHLYYRISGFHHYAYLHYGMFGYAGSHDCRFAYEEYIVNGQESNGCLLKIEGIKERILPE